MFSRFGYWHLLLAAALGGGVAFLYFSPASTQSPAGATPPGMTAFAGGTFEASGVAPVAGADGVLFVDNGKPGQVFWMRLGPDGKQVGEVRPVQLGASIEDIEGITTDGTHFYVVSSQSRPKAIAKAGLVRFSFDPRGEKVEGVESIGGLKDFLLENVAELRGEGEKKGKEGGVNIEGVAWDPRRGRLLLGLRSPLADGQALLVPLKLRDPRGAFAAPNLEVEGGRALRLPLGGLGIRGVEYDARAGVFRLISGATETQTLTDFGLWEWDGDERQPAPRQTRKFDRNLKPEGVARASAGGRDFTIVVFDAGGYTVLE